MTGAHYDVVVIGAGAGGGAVAWALSRHGIKVLLLDAGAEYDPARDYQLHRVDWEQQQFPTKPLKHPGRHVIAPLQALDARWEGLKSWSHLLARPDGKGHRVAYAYHHERAIGGSTVHFTGEAHRMHPAAMAMHTRFGAAADWPFDYAALEPYYTVAERIVGVAGPGADTLRPRSKPYPLPAHPHSYASQRVGTGLRKLNLSWVPNPLAVTSRPYDGRPGCNYCGQCTRGCPRTDKGTVDVTFIRKARASGHCTIRPHCQVTHLSAGADDRVTEVTYADADMRLHKVRGRIVVVAAGAVETPRLLLACAQARAAQGLANESGLVGRHFMETLSWASSALHPEALGSHRGLPSDGICWDYNAPDAIPDVIGGCRFTLNMAEASLTGPINYARRVVTGWGRAHKQAMRAQFGHVLSIGAVGESLPSPGSFVDLDPSQKDHLGMPVARIHSRLDEMELKRLQFMADKTRQMLAACGAGEIFEESGTYDTFSSTHVFGTCRMGTDPARSVVDGWCRSHRWRNLFIVDASVFPSSGGGESPSLTIEALAIRSADKMRALLMRRDL